MWGAAFRPLCVAVIAAATLITPGGPGGTPPPLPEGPAGPPARLPNGQVARPPRIRSIQVSTACPKPGYGPRYYAPGSGKTVALTFDDGPGASTRRILDILRGQRVTATFFNLGQNLAALPSLARREVAAGYRLGNHTWDHPVMANLSWSAQGLQMDRATAEQRLLTHTTPCTFRPPYGSYSSTTLQQAQRRRMQVWLWSVDTEDWKAGRSASSYWVNRIVSLAEREGRGLQHPVILMHNMPAGNPATVLALPRIIRYFRGSHYRFVSLGARGTLAGGS